MRVCQSECGQSSIQTQDTGQQYLRSPHTKLFVRCKYQQVYPLCTYPLIVSCKYTQMRYHSGREHLELIKFTSIQLLHIHAQAGHNFGKAKLQLAHCVSGIAISMLLLL